MRRRIFVAINLPEKIKNKLVDWQKKWPELPANWTKKENLHITLEFLGYLTDEDLVDLCQRVREKASRKEPFLLELDKICYGPKNSLKNEKTEKAPRMIWLTGQKIKEFNLTPHITLARIKSWQFKQIEPEERPEIEEDLELNFEVNSIEIMESELKKGGAKYRLIESCPLKR
jgi:RNA 2',3'-cyclic 3'-phosphodiesterase